MVRAEHFTAGNNRKENNYERKNQYEQKSVGFKKDSIWQPYLQREYQIVVHHWVPV